MMARFSLISVASSVVLMPMLLVAQSTTAPASAATTSAAGTVAPKPVTPKKKKVVDFTGSLGFSQASGNANALTTNVTNKMKYQGTDWTVQEDLSFYYGEANEKVNTNFWNGGLRAERTVAKRVGAFVASRYDRNLLQGVQNRFQQGFGVNVAAVDDKRNKLSVAVGGSFFQQQLTPGSVAKV